MNWTPVVTTVIGALSALGGVAITEFFSRQTQRESWLRKNHALTFAQRRKAYVRFYKAALEARGEVMTVALGWDAQEGVDVDARGYCGIGEAPRQHPDRPRSVLVEDSPIRYRIVRRRMSVVAATIDPWSVLHRCFRHHWRIPLTSICSAGGSTSWAVMSSRSTTRCRPCSAIIPEMITSAAS